MFYLMNESKNNPEGQKKCRWPIVYTTQIIGALIGLVLTIGSIWLCAITAPHEAGGDFPTFMLMLVLIPTGIICRVSGMPLKLFVDNGVGGSSDQWSISTICLVAIINAVLFLLLGWLVGKLIQNKASKSHE